MRSAAGACQIVAVTSRGESRVLLKSAIGASAHLDMSAASSYPESLIILYSVDPRGDFQIAPDCAKMPANGWSVSSRL